jgi:hypothetical protein
MNLHDNTVNISDLYMDQYINKSKIIYSKEEKYKIYNQITANEMLKIMNKIFNFENMLFIYKSRKSI